MEMPRFRSICVDLKMPVRMISTEVGALEERVPSLPLPDGSTELFTYVGVGIDPTPYLGGVLSGYTFVGLTPLWVLDESKFVLRFIFGDGTTELATDPLSVVRRRTQIHWLDYYFEQYNVRKVQAWEAPHAQGGNFLTVLLDDLVLVVDEEGSPIRPGTERQGRILHHEGSLSFNRDVPELNLLHRTGI
jgi:hypothetical protein